MTTSGVIEWSLTANDIVKAAMQELALIAPGEEPEASESRDAIVRLNGLLKSWAIKGGNLFRETSGSVNVLANTSSGVLPPGVRSVASARVQVSPTYERPMQVFNRAQFMVLPNKAAKGQPNIFYVADAGDAVTFTVWPTPTTNTTILIDYTRAGETITDGTETLDIPQEWQEAVYVGLAIRIAPMFQAAVTPELYQRAAVLETQLLDADRPDSYFFESAWA